MHFYEWCKQHRNKIPDLVIHLRPSTPFRKVSIINKAINFFLNNPKVSSLRSCQITPLTPYKLFFSNNGYLQPCLINSNYNESFNQPRQVFPKTYLPNGYIDIVRPKYLLNHGKIHGDKILLFLTPPIPDIDSIEDLNYAKIYFQKNKFYKMPLPK